MWRTIHIAEREEAQDEEPKRRRRSRREVAEGRCGERGGIGKKKASIGKQG
jgi:hypothetical protein